MRGTRARRWTGRSKALFGLDGAQLIDRLTDDVDDTPKPPVQRLNSPS